MSDTNTPPQHRPRSRAHLPLRTDTPTTRHNTRRQPRRRRLDAQAPDTHERIAFPLRHGQQHGSHQHTHPPNTTQLRTVMPRREEPNRTRAPMGKVDVTAVQAEVAVATVQGDMRPRSCRNNTSSSTHPTKQMTGPFTPSSSHEPVITGKSTLKRLRTSSTTPSLLTTTLLTHNLSGRVRVGRPTPRSLEIRQPNQRSQNRHRKLQLQPTRSERASRLVTQPRTGTRMRRRSYFLAVFSTLIRLGNGSTTGRSTTIVRMHRSQRSLAISGYC